MWNFLTEQASGYGFLGPIVGIAGLIIGAAGAVILGWFRSLREYELPDEALSTPLKRIATMFCGIVLIAAWFMANPSNGRTYISTALWLGCACVVAFALYVFMRIAYGGYKITTVVDNDKGPEIRVWGGLWLTPDARNKRSKGASVKDILAGKLNDVDAVWSPHSRATSVVVAVLLITAVIISGTAALTLGSTAAQVALTGKPARAVFSSAEVPGMPNRVQPATPPESEP